ncbi:hypothetical protein QZH41_013883 [Actinostola sp. cb2023]|nr:hypothetical protein QZH41_013883 [Actinostola sp. cb2023]
MSRLTMLLKLVQVVHYPESGHYHCHHDSEVINRELPCCTYGRKNCRLCRYLTVMIFLNDVEDGGELAFPVADNSTYNWEFWTKESYTKCNMVKHCSKSNVIVQPKAGKAVVFYNHLFDKKTQWSSALDPRALLGDCQVTKGEKWIANVWINIIGDGVNELKSWKMDTNWLSQNNLNSDIISSLKAKYVQGVDEAHENRYTRAKNTLGDTSSDNIEGPPKDEKDSDDDGVSIAPYDTFEGINTKEVKKEFLPQPQSAKPSTSSEPSQTMITEDDDPNSLPKGPKAHLGVTPAPLPLPLETMTLKEPIQPTMDSTPFLPQEGHRVLKSIMLLIDELDQVELEILARNLHSRLKLVCVPLMMNPMGTLR